MAIVNNQPHLPLYTHVAITISIHDICSSYSYSVYTICTDVITLQEATSTSLTVKQLSAVVSVRLSVCLSQVGFNLRRPSPHSVMVPQHGQRMFRHFWPIHLFLFSWWFHDNNLQDQEQDSENVHCLEISHHRRMIYRRISYNKDKQVADRPWHLPIKQQHNIMTSRCLMPSAHVNKIK